MYIKVNQQWAGIIFLLGASFLHALSLFWKRILLSTEWMWK